MATTTFAALVQPYLRSVRFLTIKANENDEGEEGTETVESSQIELKHTPAVTCVSMCSCRCLSYPKAEIRNWEHVRIRKMTQYQHIRISRSTHRDTRTRILNSKCVRVISVFFLSSLSKRQRQQRKKNIRERKNDQKTNRIKKNEIVVWYAVCSVVCREWLIDIVDDTHLNRLLVPFNRFLSACQVQLWFSIKISFGKHSNR